MSRANRRASASYARKAERAGEWSAFELGPLPDPRVWPALDNCVATFVNSVYGVFLCEHVTEWGLVRQLMVRRHDEQPIRKWYDMQRIKNEIVGETETGVEVYPPENEVRDSANMYHIWVLPGTMKLPFGLGRGR